MKFTQAQERAQVIIAGDATHILGVGGSRSGKTFLFVRNVVMRALKAPGSRHAILRFRFNHCKASIVLDTFPKVMSACFPGIAYTVDKTDWYAEYPNGAQIWFGGLDDKERTEKILGQEYVTIYLNECSQIPQGSRDIAVTRLAQLVDQVVEGMPRRPLKPRMFYDENPPSKAHWTYKLFIQKQDPDTRRAVPNPGDYASFAMNPEDNLENLSQGYIDSLKALSGRLQRRFLKGEFADATPNQLFRQEDMDRWRMVKGEVLPDFVRVVIGVDPSGSGDEDNADNDEIGIVAGALGVDGNAYLLEDNSAKVGPATWGKIATSAFDRHEANVVVGEINFGGAMVQQTIQVARPRTPFKKVTASRGKHIRAEPFSALYEQGKVRHVGEFHALEDELCGFSTVGYMGERSPNRADAWIWVLSELFPALTKPEKKTSSDDNEPVHRSWMG